MLENSDKQETLHSTRLIECFAYNYIYELKM